MGCEPVSSSAPRRKSAVAEDGFALLDVVIAIVVLMIVLIPVAYLLSTTSKIATSNQNRLTAQSLAASWLDQERVAAEQSASTTPSTISSPGGTTSSPTWPAATGTETVGTITYDIYVAGAWCSYLGAGAAWGNGSAPSSSSPPIAFFVATKVSWGPDAGTANPASLGQNDGTVVEYSSVQSQPGWTVTVSGTTESVATLTSTSGIAGNICPLALTGAV
jgi:hypothetical protein